MNALTRFFLSFWLIAIGILPASTWAVLPEIGHRFSITPISTDAERKGILDAMVNYIRKTVLDRDLVLDVEYLKEQNGWAWLHALPRTPDGSGRYEDVNGLLRKQGRLWKVVEFACTEENQPECIGAPDYFKHLLARHEDLPIDILPIKNVVPSPASPPRGSAERKAILDGLRTAISSRYPSNDVEFVVESLTVQNGWAWADLFPQDLSNTIHYEDIHVLLHQRLGIWEVAEIACVDTEKPECLGHPSFFAQLETRFQEMPAAILPKASRAKSLVSARRIKFKEVMFKSPVLEGDWLCPVSAPNEDVLKQLVSSKLFQCKPPPETSLTQIGDGYSHAEKTLVILNRDGILRVGQWVWSTTADSAHPREELQFGVFDLKTGHPLTLRDIFQPGFEELLAKQLEKQLRKQFNLDPAIPLPETFIDIKDSKGFIDGITSFYIDRLGVGFEYEYIASMAAGPVRIHLTEDRLKPLLKDKNFYGLSGQRWSGLDTSSQK